MQITGDCPKAYDLRNETTGQLEKVINDNSIASLDPLIKMALIHHQFESFHRFYDGNGRTGKILNVLFLVQKGLLDIPILYLSRYLIQTKQEYYRLLQAVRDSERWEDWIAYMLKAVEQTALATLKKVEGLKSVLMQYKHNIRAQQPFHAPLHKIEFIMEDLKLSRLTASNYLNALVEKGFLEKRKLGRNNYYINTALYSLLTS